ncbi:hypothetical protein, partial [Aeromicrobium duanguangcaii]
RTSATAPKELIRWSGGKGVRTNYGSLTAFRTAVGGQETSGTELLGGLPASLPNAGVPIPSAVASVIGVAGGTLRVGRID